MSENVDRIVARVGEALARLREGDAKTAEQELEALLAQHAGSGAIADHEIERAFETAETNPDEMVDANDIAEQAMEAALGPAETDEPEAGFAPTRHPTYATETMADLLERQGDADGAHAIRSRLEPATQPGPLPEVAAMDVAQDQLRTLERWLQNIRRGVA